MNRRFVTAVWSSALESDENRDAAAAQVSAGAGSSVARVAVADGASRTLFSGPWARTIAEAAVQGWPELGPRDLLGRTDALRATFDPLAQYRVDDFAVRNKWMNDASQTTVVAATVTIAEATLNISSMAVGDSVLMILDKERGTVTFPPLASTDFGRSPDLITSRPGQQIHALRWQGQVAASGLLLLATDGAARPLIAVVENEGTEVAWHRVAQLAHAFQHHGAADADLADALLGDPARSFQDDATVLVCAAVPDVPGVADIELLSAFLSDPVDSKPGETACRSTRHRLPLSGRIFSDWRERRTR